MLAVSLISYLTALINMDIYTIFAKWLDASTMRLPREGPTCPLGKARYPQRNPQVCLQ